MKNASSWSSLAQSPTTNSPLPPPPTAAAVGTKAVADQFLAFKRQAKEKAEKVNCLVKIFLEKTLALMVETVEWLRLFDLVF